MSETLHLTCVAIGDAGVLIEGASGAGKSDLALRLIDRGAVLVSDDYTVVTIEGDALIARPPPTLAGKIEVRGVGILPMEHRAEVRVHLLVTVSDDPPRLPPVSRTRQIAGVTIREIALSVLEPSAPIKVELALRQELAR
jgi:serine kinase of HPr protein (carbohydrate metabolism regulator)